MLIGGAFVRSESGRALDVNAPGGKWLGHVCRASRKDFRNAVVAARKAASGWANTTPYLKGQILYRAAEMLEDFYDRLDPEKRADYFLMIRREIQRLTAMLQDVLLQGQLEAGRVQFQPRPTDVVALCREVVARTQTAFPKHPPVHFETDAPAWRTLADEKLLERVLSNLLSNAFKYSPALTPVHFTIRRAGKEWEIQVRDQGLGISEADQAALFSAFQRGSNVGSIKGAGVGLYVVKKCAELHGGRMEVHSQAGQGSTFVFAFPWQPAEAAPIATP
jgi:signal transduction histidine kinase